MVNRSGKSWRVASFKASLYDARGRLIGTADIHIENFRNGDSRTFDAGLSLREPSRIARFKIAFEDGFEQR